MSMMETQASIAVGSSLTATLAATWLDHLSISLFGFPISVLFASFAGAIIILAIIPPMPFGKALIRIASGTVAAAFLTPAAVALLKVMGFDAGGLLQQIAFLMGLFVLFVLEGGVEVLRRLPADIRDRVFGKGGR